MKINHNHPKDPAFRCRCRAHYYVPQDANWSREALERYAEVARAKGWTIPDYGQDLCPECTAGQSGAK